MKFSSRTNWYRQPNRLSVSLDARRARGESIVDLTSSNPTECGFKYPKQEILAALANPLSLHYQADPHGLLSSRQVVAEYYGSKGIPLDPSGIFLTSGTSEGYSLVFKLLCNSGESILVPQPSYPLFEYLAQINDVNLNHYRLSYDHEWHLNIDSIARSVTSATKAIVLLNPHNPTGVFLKSEEWADVREIAHTHHLALIVDEVFIDYVIDQSIQPISTAAAGEVLTFTLNGISKSMGLPQMKLGWIVLSGKQRDVTEVSERLEIVCDTFLSVNTPVQVALPELAKIGTNIQRHIVDRVRSNHNFVTNLSQSACRFSPLRTEGGWYAILRVPRTKSDEEWALELLQERGIHLHPGYLFDFDEEEYLVVSLLVEEPVFQHGIHELAAFFS